MNQEYQIKMSRILSRLLEGSGLAGNPLDDRARREAPGSFIALAKGRVHYETAGPEKGIPLVLVHGLSVPGYIWDPVFHPLARAGFRVIRFDLYGRGFSDRPKVRYDADLFDAQLAQLFCALNITGPVHLAGVSMGGAICARFASCHPERVDRLCLINPAGMMPRPGLPEQLKLLPGLGECHMGLFGRQRIIAGLYDDFYTQLRPKGYKTKMIQQIGYAGFRRALLSTLRSGILHEMEPIYRSLGKTKLKMMLIWGKEDRVIPHENCIRLRGLIPDMVCHFIDKTGHLPHYEDPEQVLPLLVKFFNP